MKGQSRAMSPMIMPPITRAAILRPKTQPRTADSGKGSICLECPMFVTGCSRETDRQSRSRGTRAVRNDVGIDCGAFSGGVKVSAQAARSIG
jgi:hypothetical protein